MTRRLSLVSLPVTHCVCKLISDIGVWKEFCWRGQGWQWESWWTTYTSSLVCRVECLLRSLLVRVSETEPWLTLNRKTLWDDSVQVTVLCCCVRRYTLSFPTVNEHVIWIIDMRIKTSSLSLFICHLTQSCIPRLKLVCSTDVFLHSLLGLSRLDRLGPDSLFISFCLVLLNISIFCSYAAGCPLHHCIMILTMAWNVLGCHLYGWSCDGTALPGELHIRQLCWVWLNRHHLFHVHWLLMLTWLHHAATTAD